MLFAGQTEYCLSNIANFRKDPLQGWNIPGHPRVEHQSSSSVMRHCNHEKAPLASPLKASSRSNRFWVHKKALANSRACLYICRVGRIRAWVISRWSSHVSLSALVAGRCCSQKLEAVVSFFSFGTHTSRENTYTEDC